MCQCPERGDTHFYLMQKSGETVEEQGVNALKGATLISTGDMIRSYSAVDQMCQCPERGDTHFYRASVNPGDSEFLVSMP